MAAAIVRHVLRKTGQQLSTKTEVTRLFSISNRNASLKSAVKGSRRIDSVAESIASKGFLRSHRPYTPPATVTDDIQKIRDDLKITEQPFASLNAKSEFLARCFEHFNHGIPNSQLHEMNTVDAVIRFYKTPVSTTLPMDALQSVELPKNLHIIQDYHRFQPEQDTMFKGQTAFPKSSTLVTGLKYKKKYKGHVAKTSWP